MSTRMSTSNTAPAAERVALAGVELEVLRSGAGNPLLLLHGFQHLDPASPLVELLAREASLIAPSHPGFGKSSRPDDFRSVYDLVNLYLGFLDTLPQGPVTLMGLSFGGWLAAEIAVKAGKRIGKLILVDALGIRISEPTTPDILDIFNAHPREVTSKSWHDAEKFAPRYDDMEDEDIIQRSQNWETLCRYGHHPYMHQPQLKRWLPSIKASTLVLWGASDGIVKPSYGQAYAKLIPGARFETIPNAGHHPEIEQPEALAAAVRAFLKS
ncbi:MAG: alpha/beta hydrolase [Betaproteobacteria bacterium]|nr:alpha/beta hydrolase [Betaproteobacteria bacterium]